MANPLSQEQATLRTSLIPGLLESARLNFRRQNTGVQLFETGRIFFQNPEGRHEARRVALLLGGDTHNVHWRQKKRKADFHDLSGALGGLLNALRISSYEAHGVPVPSFHPKRCITLLAKSRAIAWAGEIHPDVCQALDTTEPLFAAEIDLQALMELSARETTYLAPSPYPPVRRDLSMVAPESCPYEKIAKTLQMAGGQDLESISLMDLFTGEKIGSGKKSLTVSLLFRNREKTLNDADVEKLTQRMISDLETKCEAKLRT